MKEHNYEYWKKYHGNDKFLYLSDDVSNNPSCQEKVAFELVNLFNKLKTENPAKICVKRGKPIVARIEKFFIRVRENNVFKIIDGKEFVESSEEEYTICALLANGKECIFGTLNGKYIMYGKIAVWLDESRNTVYFGSSEHYDANFWERNHKKNQN